MGEEEWLEYKALQSELRYEKYSSGEHVTRWRQRTKMKLIQYKGGKCTVCGYDKPVPRAYDFHHKDPSKKDFTISSGIKSLDRLKKEVDKCDLLCCRCHAEKHDMENSVIRSITITKHENKIEKLKELRRRALHKYGMSAVGDLIKCKFCGTEIVAARDGQSTCSKECRRQLNIKNRKCKNRPSKEELKELISKLPWTKIGQMYSVTGNSVRKWARSYGLMAR